MGVQDQCHCICSAAPTISCGGITTRIYPEPVPLNSQRSATAAIPVTPGFMFGTLVKRTSRVVCIHPATSRNYARRITVVMDEHPKQTKRRDKQSHQQSSAKLKGSPRDDLRTRLSKTLSYVLRHGAEKEGIPIRPDGFVLVNDLVGGPRVYCACIMH